MNVRGFVLRGWQITLLVIALIWQAGWTWATARWAMAQPSGHMWTTVANSLAVLPLFTSPTIILVTIVVATAGRRDRTPP